MPRRKEERDRPLYRVNVMLDQEALDKAKKKAVEDDVRNVANVTNTSRFLRWLVERYNEAHEPYTIRCSEEDLRRLEIEFKNAK
jgi:hypothetical protein